MATLPSIITPHCIKIVLNKQMIAIQTNFRYLQNEPTMVTQQHFTNVFAHFTFIENHLGQ